MKLSGASLLGSTILVCFAIAVWRWSRKPQVTELRPVLCALMYVGASTALTQHALSAEQARVALVPLKSSPDLGWLYLALHFGLVLWVGLGDLLPPLFGLPAVWPAVLLFSSYLYFGTFTFAEQGAPYVMVYVLVIGAALQQPWRLPGEERRVSLGRRYWASLLLFVALLGLSTAFSLNPGDSLTRTLQILCFALLPVLLARDVAGARQWRLFAGWTVVLGGAILVGLAGLKFVVVGLELGLVPALSHRLYIDEIGPNWVARPLVILLPLAISLLRTASRRVHKVLWGAAIAGMLVTLTYSQSDEGVGGWLALVLGLGSLWLLRVGPAFAVWWRGHKRERVTVVVVASVALVALAGLGVWLSASANAYSFNGRLYVWRVALRQVAARPLTGSGLGVRYKASPYSMGVSWEDVGPRTQWFIDRPLSRWWRKRQTSIHTHNILLEWAVGGGVPAMLAFLWFLWELGRRGLAALSQARGHSRVLVAGCVAGLVAALGWGALDVLEYSPPFFSFPSWALIGLLLVAPRALGETGKAARSLPEKRAHRPRQWVTVVLLLLAAPLVGVPLVGNAHYQEAYVAYQEQRWPAAIDALERASRWEPLNAKYRQLLGETLINEERYAEAIAAYETAARLKKEYAPHYAQLGWLAWLQGDAERATAYLEQAVALDPREIWRDGLHAELGLAFAFQGRVDEAVQLFATTLEIDPERARAPYWVPVQSADGSLDLVLDAAYLPGEGETGDDEALRRRILGHLSKADYTARRFAPLAGTAGAPSIVQVLDAIEAYHASAQKSGTQLAPRLLASVAEAARLVGLHDRAQETYVAFQETYPASAYGFRDLGVLLREQGRLEEAYLQAVRAVQVSSRNVDSWIELAETALDQGRDEEAARALDTLYRLDPLTPELYVLRARLYQDLDQPAQAARALNRSLALNESVANRLLLAQLYRQQGDSSLAHEQCVEAAELLLDMWTRPLDPALWDAGVCLAERRTQVSAIETYEWPQASPLIGNVLMGHVYRAADRLEEAHGKYQQASRARPEEGAPHYFLGETYRAVGQLEHAERHFREATRLDPGESLSLLALGQLQSETGQQAAALESLKAAVTVTPGWGPAHVALGDALYAAGDLDGASEHYRLAQIVERDLGEGIVYDLTVELAQAEVDSPDPRYVRNDYLSIGGERQRVLFAHPPSRVRFRLSLPEGAVLAFDVATDPESWDQPGDGVSFAVYVSPADRATKERPSGGEPVWSVYLDPKQDLDARRWHAYEVDLARYAGEDVYLTFETAPGLAGDERFDWANWGDPCIIQR